MSKKKLENSVIMELYEDEADNAKEQAETIQVSVPLDAEFKFLLEALAERFRVPMVRIVRPILQEQLLQSFLTLKPVDQDKVAEVADKKTQEYLIKLYEKMGGTYEHHGLGYWAGNAYYAQGKGKNESEAA